MCHDLKTSSGIVYNRYKSSIFTVKFQYQKLRFTNLNSKPTNPGNGWRIVSSTLIVKILTWFLFQVFDKICFLDYVPKDSIFYQYFETGAQCIFLLTRPETGCRLTVHWCFSRGQDPLSFECALDPFKLVFIGVVLFQMIQHLFHVIRFTMLHWFWMLTLLI